VVDAGVSLHEFVVAHRDAIVGRCVRSMRERYRGRTDRELVLPLPPFLDELQAALRAPDDAGSLSRRGAELLARLGAERRATGFPIEAVVHDYGGVCDAVSALAEERHAGFTGEEMGAMNRSVDAAMARALMGYLARARSDELRERAVLLGSFAHEVRNALTTAAMCARFLRAGKDLAVKSDVLERALQDINALVGQALAEAQLAGGVEPRRERVPVHALVTQVIESVAPERGVRLRLEVDEGLVVEVDPRLICSALHNLVQNALKFSRDGGEVIVRALRAGGDALLQVEDRCGGLGPEQARFFQPFTTCDQRGVGLGLLIAKRAVIAHGGTIEVGDLPGVGCVFTVRLPDGAFA
jgi:signal transduction histidine kinase